LHSDVNSRVPPFSEPSDAPGVFGPGEDFPLRSKRERRKPCESELRNVTTVSKATIALAAVFAIAMTTFASFAASDFIGTWSVKDTAGQPFEITLSGNGAAKASRGEGMVGTWKEEGKSAVITWNTGWTTKITKEDDHYKKTAYRKGQPLDGPPANSSDAKKAK
jgi:hypothetical protein